MTEQKQPALVSWKVSREKGWGTDASLPNLWQNRHKACMRPKVEERGAPFPDPL